MIERLHSAIVEVADFDGAVRDHARMLGFQPTRLERGPGGSRSAFFVVANTALEVREVREGSTGEGAPPRSGQAGLRFVWAGGDPVRELAAAGIAIEAAAEQRGEDLAGAAERRWTRFGVDQSASRRLPVELISDETPDGVLDPGERQPVAGAEDPTARIEALDHVVVMSAAPDATRDFYSEGLGIRLALDETFAERGVRLLFFRLAGLTIEIGARAGGAPDETKADRFGGLAWRVRDVDAIQARLERDGFDVSPVRTGHKPGTRVCSVVDPVHGVPTLLIEPAPAA